MTKEELTKKIKDNPDNCPFCGSGDLAQDGYPDYLGLKMSQCLLCGDCGKEWTATYKFDYAEE